MTRPEKGEAALLDAHAFAAMAAECGWSTREFARFYADGSRKEIAGLAAAVKSGNLDEVARLAHGARGSSAAACVPTMAAAYFALEQAAAEGLRDETTQALAQAGALLDDVLAFLERSLDSGRAG